MWKGDHFGINTSRNAPSEALEPPWRLKDGAPRSQYRASSFSDFSQSHTLVRPSPPHFCRLCPGFAMVRLDYLVSPMNPLGGTQKKRDEAQLARSRKHNGLVPRTEKPRPKTSVSLREEKKTYLAFLQDPRYVRSLLSASPYLPRTNRTDRPAMELQTAAIPGEAPVAVSDAADDVPLQAPPDPSPGL